MNTSAANPYAPPRVRVGQLSVSLAVLLGVLVAWTALVVIGVLPSSVSWPRARLPLETSGVFVVGLLSALAYIRYSLTGAPSQLFVSLAFVALASTQLVLGVVLHPGTLGITTDKALYLWMPGWLFAGLLLLAATFPSNTKERDPSAGRLREFLVNAALVGGGLLPIEMVLWLARRELPSLSVSGTGGLLPRLSSGQLPAVTTTDVLLGLALTGTYLVVAYRVWRGAEEQDSPSSRYLVLALPVAAFSHLHNMLLPAMSAGRISSGDALRVLFWATLVIGQIAEVRATYFSERARARELASAYETELARVRDLEQIDRDKAELVHEAADAVDQLGGRLQVMVPAGAEGVLVLADRTRVLQVTRNLLLNAESYSEAGTPVGLEVVTNSTKVVFSVKDRGPGIPPEQTGLLFKQFSRLPGSERDGRGGSGLGLYISRQIVEAHGGRIWVESTVGEGSSFSFSLPRSEDAG